MGIEVHTEVELAKLPYKADLILLKKRKEIIHPLWTHLYPQNIIELKTAFDKTDQNDIDTLYSYGLSYKRKANIRSSDLALWFILPQMNKPFLKNLHEIQNRKITTLFSGFHQTEFMEYPLCIVETNHLPLEKDHLDLKLFGKRGIVDVLQWIIESQNPLLIEEGLGVAHELYRLELKEAFVSLMPRTKKRERSDKEVIEMMVETFGIDEVIQSLGKTTLLRTLLKKTSKEELKQILEEEQIL